MEHQKNNVQVIRENQDETIDIKKFIFKVLSNWYWFVLTIFVSLVVAYYVNKYTTPIYRISASILIQDQQTSSLSGVESILNDLGLYNRARRKKVENEIGILKSYSLANKTLQNLNFDISYYSIGRIKTLERYKDRPFTVHLDTSLTNEINTPVYVTLLSDKEYLLEIDGTSEVKKRMKYGEKFSSDRFNFYITFDDVYDDNNDLHHANYYFIINDINVLTNLYKNKLNVETLDDKSSMLILSLQGNVPAKEVDYLNKLCDVYIQSGLDEKNQIAINTINFIDEQLKEITDSLTNVENRLMNFRQYNQLVDINKEGMAYFEKYENLQSEKAKLVIQMDYFDYLKKYIENGQEGEVLAPGIMGVNDQLLTTLVEQLNELYNQKGVTEYSSTEKNPSLALINIKIQNTKSAILENINNLINTTKISISNIDQRINKVQAEIKKLPLTEKEFMSIERKFNLNNEIYTYLLEKRAEAGIAKASNISENKIIDYAILNNASIVAPKKSLNYIIALIIGFIIPLLVIIIRDFFNDKILERKDVEDNTNIPIIGTVGHNNKGTDLVVYEKPKSSIAESFRTIRTNLQYFNQKSEKKSNVIVLSSTVSGEGKTFCTINLACIFALSAKKTIILGMDLRKPKLHKEFNMSNDVGLSTYLIRKNTKEEIIKQTQIENLDFIPSGPIPPNPAELIDSDRMKELIEQLKTEYSYIIIDTPPVALVTDALLISKFSDISIFVVRQNFSSKTVLKFVNDIYYEKGMKNLSILINDVQVPSYYGYRTGYGYRYGGYGYSYGYGYGSGYGYGYYDDDEEILKKNNFLNRLLRFLKIKN
ncbi:MAG: tyrosine-protein kinase domain-containing protein [Marinilabiliales bacterium]